MAAAPCDAAVTTPWLSILPTSITRNNVTTRVDGDAVVPENGLDDDHDSKQELNNLLREAWKRRRRKHRDEDESSDGNCWQSIVEAVRQIRGPGDRTDQESLADRVAERLVLALGWVVAWQSLGTLLSANGYAIANEVCVCLPLNGHHWFFYCIRTDLIACLNFLFPSVHFNACSYSLRSNCSVGKASRQ